MLDVFLLAGLPYIAIVGAIVGSIFKWRKSPYTISSKSSQFFEDRWLIYGSLPWHLGIIVVVIGHLIAFFLPGVWQSALRNQGIVIIVEAIGFGAALLAAAGLIVLIIRRITSARLQIVTSTADIAVSVLILLQVLLGIHTALSYRYGSVWSVGTVVPYLWSVILLKPDISFVANFPMSFKLHIAFGWLIIAVLPFTRLIHLLAAPVSYIWRSPQIVIWNNFRRGAEQAANLIVSESRREF
ncbi:MAG: respiratory nitrate reductase subunit gamma, partial [Limisphaerales bacterium]